MAVQKVPDCKYIETNPNRVPGENMLEFMGDAVESDHDVEDFIENGETGTMITIKYNINEEIYEIPFWIISSASTSEFPLVSPGQISSPA